jgi:hypothetical protein
MRNLLLLFSLTTLLTTNAQTPQINAILVNSCGASEGMDELISVTIGSSPILVSQLIVDFPNATPSNYCNSGCGANTILENTTTVASLNGLAGCSPSLFVSASIIPAGATMFIFTGNPPTIIPDYTSLCGGGPIYALFCNNTSDGTGRFANTGTSTRTLTITFASGVTDAVTYLPNSVATGDGAVVNFSPAGVPSYPTNTSPSCNAIALNVRWGELFISNNEEYCTLTWETYSEINNNYFEVVQLDLFNKTEKIIGKQKGAGNSTQKLKYEMSFSNPTESINYFKVRQVDNDGNSTESNIISNYIENDKQAIVGSYSTHEIVQLTFSKNIVQASKIVILDINGKPCGTHTIEQTTKTFSFPVLEKGLYFICIEGITTEVFKYMSY